LIDQHNYLDRGDEFTNSVQCLREILCPSGQWDPFDLDMIIIALRNHSLINVVSTSDDAKLVSMHPLVHEWARLRRAGNTKPLEAAAIRLLCCGAIRGGYFMTRYLFSHVQALSSAWEGLHVNDAASFSRLLRQSGIYAEATKLQERSYETLRSLLGIKHLSTLLAATDLADNYRQLGRLAETEALDEDVWKYRRELLGDDHLDTIHASAHLAYTYGQLGRHIEAEKLQVQVVEQRKRLLGDEDLETIRASANLALTYDHLGRWAEAAEMGEEVVKRREMKLGAGHPDTILARSRLATTYRHLGRYGDAEKLGIDVLNRRMALWCEQHPETLYAMLSLAQTYYVTKRDHEGYELAKRARDIALSSLGENHPLYKEITTFAALCSCT